MQVLKTRLYDMERQRVHDERSADRKSQVGSGIALNVFAPIISPRAA